MENEEKNLENEQENIVTEPELDNQDEEEQFDWKSEALKQKAIASRLKNKLSQPQKQLPTKNEYDDEVIKKINRLDEIENKRQFGYENNLSPEETDFVFKFTNGKPTKEALENPFVKSGLEGYRTQKKLEANIPSSSSSHSPFQGKQFKDLPEEDKKKAFEEAGKKFIQ